LVARFDVETPTRLRKEVEDLTANMQALVNLTPTQLKATASRRYSTCRGSNRYITHNQGLKRVHYTKPWPQTGTLHKAMTSNGYITQSHDLHYFFCYSRSLKSSPAPNQMAGCKTKIRVTSVRRNIQSTTIYWTQPQNCRYSLI